MLVGRLEGGVSEGWDSELVPLARGCVRGGGGAGVSFWLEGVKPTEPGEAAAGGSAGEEDRDGGRDAWRGVAWRHVG